jgi:hypothetical protein
MKNVFVAFALLASVLGVSCKKGDEANPQTSPASSRTIDVEYLIQCPSGAANADYIAPDADGNLAMTHEEINRTSKVVAFTCPSGIFLSVSASNAMPSHDVVQVKIFVDGVLVADNSTTDPAQKAIAQGNF